VTFEELDQRFPNGFDDAEITAMAIDYSKRQAILELNLRQNSPDSPDRDVYTHAQVRVIDFYYLSIEPPDSDHLFPGKREKITVDGFPEDPNHFEPFANIKPKLPDGAFHCRFFVHDWNSFIHVAARDAEFSSRAPKSIET
jgi:hypothetical protein